MLEKRQIAETGIEVSVIGLGTVKFGRNQGVKYPEAFDLPSDAEIKNLLSVASELDINLLDTAPAYGSSEERLGKLLGADRSAFVLSTKVGEEFVNGESHFDFSPAAIRASVERSLDRLRTDYLDVVLVHSNGDDMTLIQQDDVFATLAMLRDHGKVRAYGMSTKTIAGGKATLQKADVAMVAFNPNYLAEQEVLSEAARLHKSVFVKKAFASGHAANPETLRFILDTPGVTSVIVGTLNAEHLRENVLAVI